MLRNVFNKDVCRFLIQQLGTETDKYIVSDILDCLTKLSIPQDFDISLIIEHSKSEKWLIRHSAINALGSSASQESRQALLYYLNQDDEDKYKYEIIYSNSSLGKIGTEADIPFLQKHINSRKRDIRISARIAIENISQRS
jgi:HEAT repeat protein